MQELPSATEEKEIGESKERCNMKGLWVQYLGGRTIHPFDFTYLCVLLIYLLQLVGPVARRLLLPAGLRRLYAPLDELLR